MGDKMKIAIVVHGRFFVFDTARELIAMGHDVILLTNYPKSVCEHYGIPRKHVRSFVLHGVLSRFAGRLGLSTLLEPALHTAFSRWAAGRLAEQTADVVLVFSGVAEEVLTRCRASGARTFLVRASSHIAFQARLLEEEEKRVSVRLERPTRWMIAREEREYELADAIIVVSEFCLRSFEDRGFSRDKVTVIPLGVNLNKFKAPPEAIEHRAQRILGRERLRVLSVGTFSYRKGALDLCRLASLSNGAFEFRFVGAVAPEAKHLAGDNSHIISFCEKADEMRLPEHYAWADVFVFPTIEDGYPVVLVQALAAGLPLLTTANCSGPELVRLSRMGWVLPIRDPREFLHRLQWCDSHREELVRMMADAGLAATMLGSQESARLFAARFAAGLNRGRDGSQ